MKRFLICIATLVVAFMCASCEEFAMKGDTFTVIKEEKHPVVDSLSRYTLRYNNNKLTGTGSPTTELDVVMNSNTFDVGDKVKLVKVED